MDATADLEEYKFMFKQRLISGIILVLIAAFGLYMGGIVTFAMTLIVALIGYSEILKIYHIEKSSLAVIGYTGTILYYVALLFDLDQWTTAIIILFLIFLLGERIKSLGEMETKQKCVVQRFEIIIPLHQKITTQYIASASFTCGFFSYRRLDKGFFATFFVRHHAH